MRSFFIGSIFAGVVFASAPVVLAQTATPDFSGVWGMWEGARATGAGRSFEPVPAMTPAAAMKYKALTEALQGPREYRNLVDPVVIACAPRGPTRALDQGRPFEIIQTRDRVFIFHEVGRLVRRIWIDGRGHPADLDPTWMGHSIGKYEGDTLVVDTVGLNDKTWIYNEGSPHSEALHVVERFRRVNRNTLEVAVTYEDPEVYTKPWSGKFTFTLNPDPMGELLEWVDCEDRIIRLLKSDPCEGGVWELRVLCGEVKKGIRRSP